MENEIRRIAGVLWHWAWLIAIGTVLAAGFGVYHQPADAARVLRLDQAAGE